MKYHIQWKNSRSKMDNDKLIYIDYGHSFPVFDENGNYIDNQLSNEDNQIESQDDSILP